MADIKYLVTVDASGAVKEIKPLTAEIDALRGASGKADVSMGGLWKQFAAGQLVADALKKGLKFLLDQVGDCIKGAIESEQSEKNLETALASTGRTVETLLPQYLKFSQAQSLHTKYTDEEINATQALLVQFTDLDTKGIQRATKGAMGLASVLGIDLNSATKMVTNATEGSYAALSKIGIKISENLSPQEKQNELIRQLAPLYDRAESEITTFGGALGQMKKMWGEVAEAIGSAITNNQAIRDLIKSITDRAVELIESGKLDEWVKNLSKALDEVLPRIIEFVDWMIKSTTAVADFFLGTKELRTTQAYFDLMGNAAYDSMQELEGLRRVIVKLGQDTTDIDMKIKLFRASMQGHDIVLRDVRKSTNDVGNNTKSAAEKMAALAKEAGVLIEIGLERKLQQYKDALVQLGDSMPFAEQEKLKKQIEETERQLSEISNTARASALPLRGLQDTTMKLALGFDLAEKEGERFGNALRMQGMAVKVWAGSLEDGLSILESVADETVKIGAMMDLGKWGEWKEAPKAAKEAMSEVSTIMTQFIQDISRDLVGIIGLDKIFGFKAEDFDDSYFKRALSEAEDFFDAQRRQYDDALDGIRDYYGDIEKASRKRYDDERDLVGEQYDEISKTKRREYEDQRDWIEENVKDETQRKAMLKQLHRDYEDWVDNLKKEEKDKLKAMEENHQLELDKLRNDQKAKEDQLKQDLVTLEENKKKEMDRIRADEDKARDDLADREEKRQNSLWTRLKTSFGKVCEDLLELWVSTFIKGLVSKKAEEGLADAASSITSSIGGAITTLASTLASIGEGIAGAVVAVAKGVATAATIIAASAKEILIAAGIALAIKSAFEIIGGIIGSIFGKGDGKQTDVTYWLKMIKDNSQILVNYFADTMVPATHNIEKSCWDMAAYLSDIKLTSWDQTEQLYKIAENTYGTWEALKGVIPAQSGVDMTVGKSTLFMAHKGERVQIGPENFNINPGQVVVNVQLPNGQLLMQQISDYFPTMTRNRQIKIHSNALITN